MILKLIKKISNKILLRHDPVAYARSIGVVIGENCRLIGINSSSFGSEPYLIKIGNHVTITRGTNFITHDGSVWVFRPDEPDIDLLAPIKIGNNVFIGMNTIILPDTVIGDNCIIGAGSVVKGELDSNSVYAGIPAKRLCSINEYRKKNASRFTPTKKMTSAQKQAFFMDKHSDE